MRLKAGAYCVNMHPRPLAPTLEGPGGAVQCGDSRLRGRAELAPVSAPLQDESEWERCAPPELGVCAGRGRACLPPVSRGAAVSCLPQLAVWAEWRNRRAWRHFAVYSENNWHQQDIDIPKPESRSSVYLERLHTRNHRSIDPSIKPGSTTAIVPFC
ncbi:hypothetical protein NDU88_003252 [Pleurodeles waltl]|uniref:Uncharacterized protein n=1 Tax=Pleurodeles waltl TaxID=8319 RepID=A0AAV7W1V8_PLEWA|nr:hypothetical protein NDU88_003252 [Pleurodeles waltl]